MIKLYTLPPAFGLRNVSPFCLKVEMALTHLGIPFEHIAEPDPRKSPKGKMPYLVDDDLTIPDSELILEHLDEKSQGGLFGSLTPEEIAQGRAFSRLAEDHLYWLMVSSRWLEDDWFPHVVSHFFGFVPGIFRGFAAGSARRGVARTLDLHGLGRHTHEEQVGFLRRDLEAIAAVVDTDGYIVGKRLTVYDFTVAGMLSGLMDNEPPTWVSKIANEYQPLRDYLERIQTEVGVWGKESSA